MDSYFLNLSECVSVDQICASLCCQSGNRSIVVVTPPSLYQLSLSAMSRFEAQTLRDTVHLSDFLSLFITDNSDLETFEFGSTMDSGFCCVGISPSCALKCTIIPGGLAAPGETLATVGTEHSISSSFVPKSVFHTFNFIQQRLCSAGLHGYISYVFIPKSHFILFRANNLFHELRHDVFHTMSNRPSCVSKYQLLCAARALLLLSGDIESNPGPIYSKISPLSKHELADLERRNNDPRRQADRLSRYLAEYKRIIRTIRRSAPIRPQMFGTESVRVLAQQLPAFNVQISRIASFLENQVPVIQSSLQNSTLLLSESFASVQKNVVMVIIVVLLVMVLMQMHHYKTAILSILSLLCFSMGVPSCIKDLWEVHVRPQGFGEDLVFSEHFSLAGKILFSILSFLVLKTIPGKNDFDSFLRRLDAVSKGARGAQSIVEASSSLFNLVVTRIKMMVLGKTRAELLGFSDYEPLITEWCDEVIKYTELQQRDKIDVTPELAIHVEGLYTRGLAFQKDTLVPRKLLAVVAATMPAAKGLYEYVSRSPVRGGGPRMRPVSIWLIGESGVGKTKMMMPLCIDILRAMGITTPDAYQNELYARQVETEYWDGYSRQKIVIYDDAFQLKDDKTKPNPEIMEVIRSNNMFPHHIHMANLCDKNTFLQAEVLIYTSNQAQVELESITHPEAFYNRMNENAYTVVPKLEYQRVIVYEGGKTQVVLDKTKLDPTVPIDLSIYQLQKVRFDVNDGTGVWTNIGQPISYDEFARVVCQDWRSRKNESLNDLNFLSQYAIRPQMGDVFEDASNSFDIASLLSERLRNGVSLEDIESEFACSDVLFEAYMDYRQQRKPTSVWTKYLERISVVRERVASWIKEMYVEVRRIISEHPILTLLGLLGTVVVACSSFYFLFSSNNNDVSSSPTKSWSGRVVEKVTERVRHAFSTKHAPTLLWSECEYCCHAGDEDFDPDQCPYSHDWTGSPGVKIENGREIPWSKCDYCKAALFYGKTPEGVWCFDVDRCPYVHDWSSYDSVQQGLVASGVELCCDLEDDFVVSELGHSGDVKTRQRSNIKIELGSSGSAATARRAQIRTELGRSGDATTRMQRRIVSQSGKTEKRFYRHVVAQGCSDVNAHDLTTLTLRANTYRATYEDSGVRKVMGNITFLRGWTAIMPYHFISGLMARGVSPSTIVYLSQSQKPDIIQFPLSHLFYVNDDDEVVLTSHCVQLTLDDGFPMDCVMFELNGLICHMHRDVVKHFIRKDEQGKLFGTVSASFATYQYDEQHELFRAYQYVTSFKACDGEKRIEFDESQINGRSMSYVQRQMYQYCAPTQFGDCGSVICVYNNRIPNKFVAMHVAGSNNERGYAIPLTFERLNTFLDKLAPVAKFQFVLPTCVNDKIEPITPQGSFVALGTSSLKVGQATKTSLLPSKIYGKLTTPIMCPAILRPTKINGILVDPLMNGLTKCGFQPPLLNPDWIEACVSDVCRVALTSYNEMAPKRKFQRFLTMEQAIVGADDDFMSSLSRTTSPGFPYSVLMHDGPGKRFWFGKEQDFSLDSSACLSLIADVERLIEDYSQGVVGNVVFTDTLKDEKRELAKVAVGKTRVFSAGPQHFSIAVRKFLLPFSAFLQHNRIDNEIAVGTNPYSYDWNRLALRLKSKGSHVIAGDFGNFDGSLNAQILWAIFDGIVLEWAQGCEDYDSGVGDVLRGMWASLVHSVHIFGDNVYMWTHSQPSGNPLTVILNSLYNSVVMRLSWMQVFATRDPSMMTMAKFNENVAMISYGDDNILNISDSVLEDFNQISVSYALAELGHTYTDETKIGEIVGFRTLAEVAFLKRKFRWSTELARYVAPLDKKVIYEMLNWTRRTTDPDEILMTNLETAAREIVLHGRQAYQEYVAKIKTVFDLLPRRPVIPTYFELLHLLKTDASAYFDAIE